METKSRLGDFEESRNEKGLTREEYFRRMRRISLTDARALLCAGAIALGGIIYHGYRRLVDSPKQPAGYAGYVNMQTTLNNLRSVRRDVSLDFFYGSRDSELDKSLAEANETDREKLTNLDQIISSFESDIDIMEAKNPEYAIIEDVKKDFDRSMLKRMLYSGLSLFPVGFGIMSIGELRRKKLGSAEFFSDKKQRKENDN